jgi:hypothetical protein
VAIALFINHFQRAAQATLRTANQQQCANGIDSGTLATNDFTHISRVDTQFINCGAVAFGGGDRHRVGPVDKSLNDIIQKGFHK